MWGGTFRSRSRGSKAEEIKEILNCNTNYTECQGGMYDFIATNTKLPGLGLDPIPPVKSLKTE